MPVEIVGPEAPSHPESARDAAMQLAHERAMREIVETVQAPIFFKTPPMEKLLTALKPLSLDKLSSKELELINTKKELGRKIFENDGAARQGRTLDECVEATTLGVIGEVAIAHMLRKEFPVVINDEEKTKVYWWDLCLGSELTTAELGEGFLIEVKFQHENVEGFSFKDARHFETAAEHWKDWHLVIGWKMYRDENIVRPYIVIQNEAFNPTHGYYGKSNFGGTYLKTDKAFRFLRKAPFTT
jgi:hypothetical protein